MKMIFPVSTKMNILVWLLAATHFFGCTMADDDHAPVTHILTKRAMYYSPYAMYPSSQGAYPNMPYGIPSYYVSSLESQLVTTLKYRLSARCYSSVVRKVLLTREIM
ncbi:unnamed protein product [Cylicocyclus nassatus]|uniref:Uncharacterized protein n=1 Tax=Cylicocyclus nassatus TaxID=53992 RepID=A0AA36H1M5_CYLNA|nr:unnamed protein product [Cylicocyclus nassatus]